MPGLMNRLSRVIKVKIEANINVNIDTRLMARLIPRKWNNLFGLINVTIVGKRFDSSRSQKSNGRTWTCISQILEVGAGFDILVQAPEPKYIKIHHRNLTR